MNEQYSPRDIEPRWQARWERDQLFSTSDAAPRRRYVLEMFPYPSGAMHMGHVRCYLIGDVLTRYYRMRGFDVLHPMGWDALGLPAENAAIKDKRHPGERTRENVVSFKAEMKRLGYAYDWSREISTDDPAYYKWNQWFFLKFRELGLVYRRRAAVNWCTSCQTVIANEQVHDGRCERCEGVVVLQRRPEWAFRITRYSEKLLTNLDALTEWSPQVVKKQRHWIGKSEGAHLDFRVKGAGVALRVFTTRADTVFGATYLAIAPDHELVDAITPAARRPAIAEFAAQQAELAARLGRDEELPKQGIDTGAVAIHPFTGAEIPVWAANFVVADYGSGVVMSVPAHDERDFQFARAYRLPIVAVIRPVDAEALADPAAMAAAFTDDGVLEASGRYSGMTSAAAREAIAADAAAGGFGGPAASYRQRDWGISRQRYWGTPIPIVYCDACDPDGEGISVPVDDLPVRLPEISVEKVLTGRGEAPLAKVPEFVNTRCPRCGGPALREVETMDTFVDSSWYFARYLDPHNPDLPFSREAADRWLPIDVYIGGPEHSTMHLLYFRFWTMVMRELGLCSVDEPVVRMVTQGIVNGPDGRKMGKRWGNVVAPSNIVEAHGADTARTFVMFAGPPEKDIQWSDEQVEGCSRFLQRFWRLARAHHGTAGAAMPAAVAGDALAIRRAAHKTLRQVTDDIERNSFNTAIARCMELVNTLTPRPPSDDPAEQAAIAEAIRFLCAMLAPVAPHICDEIAEAYAASPPLIAQPWPAYDPALTVEETFTYAVQVNGKLRGEVQVAADADEATVRAAAEADDKVARFLDGKTVRKFVFVPRRLVNFVVG